MPHLFLPYLESTDILQCIIIELEEIGLWEPRLMAKTSAWLLARHGTPFKKVGSAAKLALPKHGIKRARNRQSIPWTDFRERRNFSKIVSTVCMFWVRLHWLESVPKVPPAGNTMFRLQNDTNRNAHAQLVRSFTSIHITVSSAHLAHF